MDVCYIHCSVLTFKIYIILCCHWRSISDEIIPFFLIKFIFRMIEIACLQSDREELFDSVASGVVVELFFKAQSTQCCRNSEKSVLELGALSLMFLYLKNSFTWGLLLKLQYHSISLYGVRLTSMKRQRCGTQAGQEGFRGQSRTEAAVSHTRDFY